MDIYINSHTAIPAEEVRFTTSRSGGPGGQNVNKVESRVTLWFALAASAALSDEQKSQLQLKLATRINREGYLWVTSSRHRTQFTNREAALSRFVALLQEALQPELVRRPTRPPAAARAGRRQEKEHRSQVKQRRREHFGHD